MYNSQMRRAAGRRDIDILFRYHGRRDTQVPWEKGLGRRAVQVLRTDLFNA